MNFEELKLLDKHGAFIEFHSVKTAEQTGSIPLDFHNTFPHKCSCGSEMIISKNNKTIMCCDPWCEVKAAEMLAELFSRYDCKFLGYKGCLTILHEVKHQVSLKTHIDILCEDIPLGCQFLRTQRGTDYKVAVKSIRLKSNSISTSVSNMGLPTLDKTSDKIFNGYDDIDKFLKDFEEKGTVNFLSERGIYDAMVYFYLETFMPDIIKFIKWLGVSIRNTPVISQLICMSGSMVVNGVKVTKKQYLDILNELGTNDAGIWIMEFKDSKAKKTVPFIIAEPYQSSATVDIAISRQEELRRKCVNVCLREKRYPTEQEKMYCKVLYSGQEFYDFVKGGMEIYERRKSE